MKTKTEIEIRIRNFAKCFEVTGDTKYVEIARELAWVIGMERIKLESILLGEEA